MVFASADREGEGKKEKCNCNCGGVSYQTSQQFEFTFVGAGHLDSNHSESSICSRFSVLRAPLLLTEVVRLEV